MHAPSQMDGFDRLPDCLLLQIFNTVSDVKTLIRCRSLSKRFNLLVPHSDSLLLRIDQVISDGEHSDDESSFIFSLFKSVLGTPVLPPQSPAQILSTFRSIRQLRIQLPSGDLRLEKGTMIKWRAQFGETLKTCVILGLMSSADGVEEGLKRRVVWTLSALMAASVRHFLLHEVVFDHKEMERVVVEDGEGEGVVVMEKEGLKEFMMMGGRCEIMMGRTVVPCVTMRMRQDRRMGATLVVVKAADGGTT